ncbi:hypothetical protein THIX_60491 [Thiomonas sp. X19]|nr:hypothetical protein [Thiomonas sp. X19]SCC94433.1 hypothetical protein THIX_60491 [Thiomonas sp. X19]
MRPRNHVALALLKRGGGTKSHTKSRKALRRAGKMQTQKESS